MQPHDGKWYRSTKCENCIEVQTDGRTVLVRDSMNPDSFISVDIGEFKSFLDGVKSGEFDDTEKYSI